MRRNRAFMKRNLDSMRYWMFDGVRCDASMIVEAACLKLYRMGVQMTFR